MKSLGYGESEREWQESEEAEEGKGLERVWAATSEKKNGKRGSKLNVRD